MFEFDMSEFSHTLKSVLKHAATDNKKIIRNNAREAILDIVDNTPNKNGYARAGWYPAWSGLGLSGSPKTDKPYGRHESNGKVYISQGEFEDNTNDPENPHVMFNNKTVVLTDAGKKREEFKERRKNGEKISKEERESVKGQRSKVAYPFLLNKGTLKDENNQPAGEEHKGFFTETLKRKKFEFGNFYKRNFERHSAK